MTLKLQAALCTTQHAARVSAQRCVLDTLDNEQRFACWGNTLICLND